MCLHDLYQFLNHEPPTRSLGLYSSYGSQRVQTSPRRQRASRISHSPNRQDSVLRVLPIVLRYESRGSFFRDVRLSRDRFVP